MHIQNFDNYRQISSAGSACLDPGEWCPHPEMFLDLSHGCWIWTYWPPGTITEQVCIQGQGSPDRSSECFGGSVRSVQPNLCICLKHPCLLCRIKMAGILVILTALDWPRRIWYADLVSFLADASWTMPDRPDLVSQGQSCNPASLSLAEIAWLLKPRL